MVKEDYSSVLKLYSFRVADDLCGRPGILCGRQTTCARCRQLVRAADDVCGSLARNVERHAVRFSCKWGS